MNGSGSKGSSGGRGPSRTGVLSTWTRTIFVVVLSLVLVALAAWTVVLYSIRLVALQDRVSSLETQCQLNELNIQKYIDDKLDKLLAEVRARTNLTPNIHFGSGKMSIVLVRIPLSVRARSVFT